ncbi:hypothetical protein NT6N_23910 [Oceaniferula spumae]|uniref:Uncharacterized protein n=1 Tax=Oceaniferula spumae TaxID=2979115 RepID=A0AAT9FN61_9BACT
MKNAKKQLTTYEQLIANLQNDPDKVVFHKKISVRAAIVEIKKDFGDQVFTKRNLKEIIEVRYPELEPVDMGNLDVSIDRASEHIECIQKAEQNIYRFKHDT